MLNYGHIRPGETRAPETEVLPDGRKRLTRFFEVTHKSKIPKELDLPYGTVDEGETEVDGWDGLRLIAKKITDEVGQPGRDTRPLLLLTFEEIAATAETQVGEPNVTQLEDGRKAYVLEWLQFSFEVDGDPNPPTPQVPGSSHTVAGVTVYLLKEEAPDDGDLRRIKRTYVTEGTIATDLQTKEGGALLIREITSVVTVPATPSGYTLIGEPTQNPNGLPIYTYRFAKGNGEVSRDIRYSQSNDQGVTGSTTVTIRHLTAGSVSSNPITPPAGLVLIEEDRTDQDGYRVWTGVYSKGVGTVLTQVETKNGGKLILYHRIALGAAPSTPSATISGTVTLIDNIQRKDSGYDIFDYTWAEGNGEISRDIDYSQSVDQGANGLTRTVIRYLTALSITTDPTSLGGSINIGFSFVCQDGYKLWTSTYAKGTGTVDSRDVAREDGSFVYYRTTLSAAAATPSTPSGSYLTDLDQTVSDGHFINRAVFVKPPETNTFRRTGQWEMPGLAYFVGTDLILQPPTTRTLLFSLEVSFATSQDTTDPFTVNTWGGFTETYIPTASGQPVNRQIGLNGYLCSGVTISGSGTYKGVAVDSYSAQRFASDPAALPTGDVVIHVDNEPYLTALDGTIVYKRTVTTVAV